MTGALLSSWLLLSALGACAFCLLVRGRRLASVPRHWRNACERVRCRVREIDADLEIVAWRLDREGAGSFVVDHHGALTLLPLKELRDAPPALFERRLRRILLATIPGIVLPVTVDRVTEQAGSETPTSR